MREGMPVLIIFPCEAFEVVFASGDRALLRPLILVSKHVCLEIFEHTTAFWKRAKAFLPAFVIQLVAAATLPTDEGVLRMNRSVGSAPSPMETGVGLKALCMEVG